jgi:hypothetical protein
MTGLMESSFRQKIAMEKWHQNILGWDMFFWGYTSTFMGHHAQSMYAAPTKKGMKWENALTS